MRSELGAAEDDSRVFRAGPRFALEKCPEIFGDELDAGVHWKSTRDVAPLGGKLIRLRFVISDSDLYVFRFGK